MLEIKHVNKTYRPKKGIPVKALDDVSLKFADRGLVFILGKSGSGKSTLLNVLGGLDAADSGEFIIKGKSSKNFSQSDFDSYRNTFIGFIFQEYNILSEFTVGANIALAMELQGKRAKADELSAILSEVDLEGYGNRKPNELSGGQKQRIAIARALIKKPEIIMADEPTGALDSRTGKQVFDTLKKLSREKLVLVVSHDREFAEQYGDRIIELKDGKIISDVSKTSLAPTEVSDGVSVIEGGFIRVKKGYKLTQKEKDLIAEYIEKADTDALISIDGKRSEEVKKVAGINDDGGKDVFSDTDESKVELKSYTPADSKLIKSKLPFKNSLKIGASSLKTKPVRLVFTVILCFIAFTLFGLADTMASYNESSAYVASIADGRIANASFTKTYYEHHDSWTSEQTLLLTDDDIIKISTETGVTVLPVYTGSETWSSGWDVSSWMVNDNKLSGPNGTIYNARISGYAELTEEALSVAGIPLVNGTLPTADDEIAIPKFIYDQLKLTGINYRDGGVNKTLEAASITGYGDIVGKLFKANDVGLSNEGAYSATTTYVKIVGIYDTDFDTTKYADYLPDSEQKNASMLDMLSGQKLADERDYGYHTVVAVNAGKLQKLISTGSSYTHSVGISPSENQGSFFIVSGTDYNYVDRLLTLSELKQSTDIDWIGGEKSVLAESEVIVPYDINKANERKLTDSVISELGVQFGVTIDENMRNDLSEFTAADALSGYGKFSMLKMLVTVPEVYVKHIAEEYEIWDKTQYSTFEEFKTSANGDYNRAYSMAKDEYARYLIDDGYTVNAYDAEHPGKDYAKKLKTAVKVLLVGAYPESGQFELNAVGVNKTGNYTVVGYFYDDEISSALAISQELYGLFGAIPKGSYGFAIGAMPYNDTSAIARAVNFSLKESGNIGYGLKNESGAVLDSINDLIETLSQVFLYIGIGFAVFASLMMFNFISVSVSQKKREIGILRAVGARSSDVFGIFLNESMIITLINFALSAVATIAICAVLNGVFRGYGMPVTILTFGLRQVGLLLGLGVVVAFIGSFVPVMRIAKKRPIDAIQNR